jgi:hypothetical protein
MAVKTSGRNLESFIFMMILVEGNNTFAKCISLFVDLVLPVLIK